MSAACVLLREDEHGAEATVAAAGHPLPVLIADGDARVVGVTAGASAPEDVVQAVVAELAPTDGVEAVDVTDEDEYFPPPRNLRDMLTAIDVAATIGFGGTLCDRPTVNDRQLHASDVLAALA